MSRHYTAAYNHEYRGHRPTHEYITGHVELDSDPVVPIAAVLSPLTLGYLHDLVMDALLHDGKVTIPVEPEPEVRAELDTFCATLADAYKADRERERARKLPKGW